jgi:lipoprotein NlpD
MRYRPRVTVLFAILGLFLVGGCTGGGFLSPDVDRGARYHSPDYRVVLRGETLYSISWDVGVDFRTLAQWNHIGPPYLLRAGQILRITAPGSDSEVVAGRDETASYHVVRRGDTVYSIARRHGLSPHQLIRWNHLRKPYRILPGQRLRLARAAGPRPRRTHRAHPDPLPQMPHGRVQHVGGWSWPAHGAVIAAFSRHGLNKGIDIAGRLGSPVVAAAGGRVVYQGSGLRGYGKLIIIEHNPDFLSAYAHCARILVKEDAKVKRGQQIATMGSTGADRVKLHFEIRLRGKPVNPLRYLPGKS